MRRKRSSNRSTIITSTNFFRPSVRELEDRNVPSFFGFGHSSAGPATQLDVITPHNVVAGREFDVVVKAEDASGHVATGYTGTVTFSLAPPDSNAVLPMNYTFTSHDRGVHEFDVTLTTTGAEVVTVTDTLSATITGSATTTVNAAPAATHFQVFAPRHIVAGVPTEVTVVALGANNKLASSYAGTIALTSSDPAATLPGNYTFVASDHGVHTFQVTFNTAGSESIIATDTITTSITGQTSVNVTTAGAVTHFGLITLGPALVGFPAPVEVVALDSHNNIVAGYTGTVHFTSSDANATLPSDYTFVAGDHGEHLFEVTFAMSGRQTVTATDTTSSSITGTLREFVFSQIPTKGHSPWGF
jgi:hypothetical protein